MRSEWALNGKNGSNLYTREWLPDTDESLLQGAVVLLHGMGEHGERYAHVAERLTDAGFAVLAMDQQGHGLSEGRRGHLSSIQDAADNASLLIEEAAERHPGLPLFLYGHSMGGNVALNCALRNKPEIAGLVLTSPWLRLAFAPSAFRIWAGKQLARLAPHFPQSTGLKPEDLYRSGYGPVSPIEGDNLCHTTITVGTFLELRDAGEWAIHHSDRLTVPTLLLHGKADRITSFEASREAADRMGKQCDFRGWEGGFHELHNDLEAESAISSIIGWLKQQL
ncbi:alpha/beta hydrolase [Paenibacillus sp. NPDC058071]|uniref:alpha/beta hydrolase n=1 Tax=Paenibacillus sp. NPDC058071 TaxID=3346326 RepID=UPI0036D93C3C